MSGTNLTGAQRIGAIFPGKTKRRTQSPVHIPEDFACQVVQSFPRYFTKSCTLILEPHLPNSHCLEDAAELIEDWPNNAQQWNGSAANMLCHTNGLLTTVRLSPRDGRPSTCILLQLFRGPLMARNEISGPKRHWGCPLQSSYACRADASA